MSLFCPDCKSLMYLRDGVMRCSRCDFESTHDDDNNRLIVSSMVEEKELAVFESDLDTLPKARIECPKCGNKEAWWHIRQTRAADEPSTRFYRCTKCKHTWREY